MCGSLLAEALKVVDLLGGADEEGHALMHCLRAYIQHALYTCGSLAASLCNHTVITVLPQHPDTGMQP